MTDNEKRLLANKKANDLVDYNRQKYNLMAEVAALETEIADLRHKIRLLDVATYEAEQIIRRLKWK